MTIALKLCGGVGNQLFQYCLGRRLADKNNDRLIFDTSYYQKAKHCKYELDKFNIRVDKSIPEDNSTQFQLIQEQVMSFIPEVLELKGNILLQGYWQSPKYLDETVVSTLPYINTTYSNFNVDYTNACVIHIRGNDYKGWKKFDICTYEYYNKAVALMKEQGFNKFYVYTDDKPYAEYLLYDIIEDKSNIILFPPTCGAYDILEMAKCGAIIGANSTFSYWGYKLGDHKVVIFPSRWFNEEPGNQQHLEINLYEEKMTLIEP